MRGAGKGREQGIEVMATILQFPQLRSSIGHENAMPTPAEILIFPGVRIERNAFNLADRIVPARRRRRSPPTPRATPDKLQNRLSPAEAEDA
jgi:hypothetical protein